MNIITHRKEKEQRFPSFSLGKTHAPEHPSVGCVGEAAPYVGQLFGKDLEKKLFSGVHDEMEVEIYLNSPLCMGELLCYNCYTKMSFNFR